MSAFPEDYKRLVLEEIKTYEGLSHPVKANPLERLLFRKTAISKLHPNPQDEFSKPEFGPNFSIVGNYEYEMRQAIKWKEDPFKSRLCVEKMSTGGYMLLDGHHRWLAARRIGMKLLPIEIMNVTPIADIKAAVAKSERKMCVSFDLDEVLLTGNTPKPSLRKNAAALIRELQELGFDVWVYTGSYISESAMKHRFGIRRGAVDGIVNGLRRQQDRTELRKIFTEKYLVSLHIDGEAIVWVNTRTKEYDSVQIQATQDEWSAATIRAVRQLDIIKSVSGTGRA